MRYFKSAQKDCTATMRRTLSVYLGEGCLVGTLRYAQQGARESATFEYSAQRLADSERFALEPEARGTGGGAALFVWRTALSALVGP